MKRYPSVLLFLAGLVGLNACNEEGNQRDTISSNVSSMNVTGFNNLVELAEFKSLDSVGQRLALQVVSAINAIGGFQENVPIDLAASIMFTKKPNDPLDGIIVTAETQLNIVDRLATTPSLSCTACGLAAAMECIKNTSKYMEDKNLTSLVVTITKAANCINITL